VIVWDIVVHGQLPDGDGVVARSVAEILGAPATRVRAFVPALR